jgi:hypothetical protein
MLKRFALLTVASAALIIPTSSAFAAPSTAADGIAPEPACHAAIPAYAQALLCGRGVGGPGAG